MKRLLILTLATLLPALSRGQQAQPFPYPDIPASLTAPPERLAFLLEHYWSRWPWTEATAADSLTGEQGFVDYVNLLQYADSALAARSTQAFADSLSRAPERVQRFADLTDHYLADPQSPLRDDVVLAHLLRALPPTPQRLFLLRQVELNQPGHQARDIVVDGQPLSSVEAGLTLLVFFDPSCDRCREVLPLLASRPELQADSGRLRVLMVNTAETPGVEQNYYLPRLPALYLLDSQKRVLLKDAPLEAVAQRIGELLARP